MEIKSQLKRQFPDVFMIPHMYLFYLYIHTMMISIHVYVTEHNRVKKTFLL